VDDRCDVKKPQKRDQLKRTDLQKKKDGEKVVKKREVERLACGVFKAIPDVKMS
jgi:hypothetical protein